MYARSIQAAKIDANLAEALHGIAMKPAPTGLGEHSQGLNILQHTGFIIG